MLARLAFALLLVGAYAAPATAERGASEQVNARPPKQRPNQTTKKPAKKSKRKADRRSSRNALLADAEPIAFASLAVTIEPVVAGPPPSELTLGEAAGVPDPPRPTTPVGSYVVTDAPVRAREGGPTWFIGIRGGPSLMNRRGVHDVRSNLALYDEGRNLRGELAIGRYVSPGVALAIAGGIGPLPRFFAPAPGFGDNTRFSIYLYHGRLDLELHRGSFVLALGGGGTYELTTGTFGARAPDDTVTMHRATYRRFGLTAMARTGVQLDAGPFAFEVLAEASGLALFRGTYEDGVVVAGPSGRELGFMGSLLLGVRLQ